MPQVFVRLAASALVAGSLIAPLHAQTPSIDATVALLPAALPPVGISIGPDGRLYVAERERLAPAGTPDAGCVLPGVAPSASLRSQIEIFDTATRARVGVLDGESFRSEAAIDPARRVSYLARTGSPDIDVIDTASGGVLRTLASGFAGGSRSISIDAARQRLYLVGTGADELVNNQIVNQRVRVLDLATERVVADLVLSHIHDARVDPATGRLWVLVSGTDAARPAASHAVVFEPHTLTELARIPVGRCASGVAFDAVQRFAYVANALDRSISVIDMTKVPARPAALPAPTDLRALVDDTTVSVSWSSIPGAVSYDLEIGSQAGTTDLIVFSTTGLGLTGPLPPGTYYLRVRARLPGGAASSPSNEVAIATTAGLTVLPRPQADVPVTQIGLPRPRVETRVQPNALCGYVLDPTTVTAGATGRTLTITVTGATGSTCGWTAAPDYASGFLTVTSGASGTGPGAVDVAIAPLSGDPRMGSLIVDEQRVTVMQCAHAVTPASVSVDANGGMLTFAVTTQGGCDWTVASQSPFLLGPAAAGSGNGNAQVTVEANLGAPRSGTVTIAGQTVAVTQAGAGGQCSYVVTPSSATAPAGGAALMFTITTQGACAWSAASNDSFLTITGATSGTGSGSATVTAANNPGAVRSGTVTIAGQTVPVTQDAIGPASCGLSVAPANISVPAAGGALTLTVNRTAGSGCNWTAVSNSGFLTFPGATSGVDDAPVVVNVSANAGSVRSGTLTVAGRTVTVTQDGVISPTCTYVVASESAPVRAAGDLTYVGVVVAEGTNCTWTAVSHTSFLTVSAMPPLTGGSVQITVAPNGGVARSGTVTVAGQTITVNQATAIPSCAFNLASTSATVPTDGGTSTFQIINTAGVDCSWTATSNSDFLTFAGASSGTSSGSVTVAAAANNGASRSGTLTIAGRTAMVTQAAVSGCTFEITPRNATVSQPSGGSVTFTVTSTGSTGCSWTAVSQTEWLTITSGSSGSGSGSVTVQAAEDTASGGYRSGTVTIAGTQVTVNQEGRLCAFDVTPATTSVSGSGGETTFTVRNTRGGVCNWTAVSNSPFLTVTSGTSGTGSGSVTITAAANSGASRTGTVTIADEIVTVVQDPAGCAFDVNGTSSTIPASGGTSTFTVTNTLGTGCSWSATSNSDFLTVSGSSGTGSGSVTVSAPANVGAARPGTVTIAGRTFTITQLATENCSFTVSPTSAVVAASGDTRTFTVTPLQGATCNWTAVSNHPFLTVTSGSTGTGPGTVTIAVAAHSGTSQRSGTVRIAGQTVTLNQDPPPQAAPCSFTIGPHDHRLPASGGTRTLNVTRYEGTNCSWTVVSQSAFVTVTSGGAGTDSGTVTFSMAENTSVARTGTLALEIAGRVGVSSVRVEQEAAGGCTLNVSPRNTTLQASGGSVTFTVTSTGGSACNWTAEGRGYSWLTITSGSSGTGSGSVTVQASEFSEAGYRSGRLTIAGFEVTVNQDGRACTSNVNPLTATVPGSGGTATFYVPSITCPWTAVSNSAFLTVTSGSSGTSSGNVTVTAAPNTGGVRTGTVTIAQKVVTIVQDAAGCTFEVSPNGANVPVGGGTSTFTVTNTQGSGCPWTATSNSPFVTVTSGSSGTGSGSVTVSTSSNAGATRSGTVTIAGRTITLYQAAVVNCEFTVRPDTLVISASGDSRTLTVTAEQNQACAWAAVSNSAFLSVTAGSSGTGSGSTTVAIAAHSGTSQRSGTLTIAGRTVTVRQDPPPPPPPCAFSIGPHNHRLTSSGGTRTLTVTKLGGTNCSWTVVSQSSFITVTGGGAGTDSGTVTFSMAENTGVAREGTLALQVSGFVGVTSVQVAQEAPVSCEISVSPRTHPTTIPAAGGSVTFTVTNTGNGTCNWTAVSQEAWLTITSGSSGSGSGSVTVQASANPIGGNNNRSGRLIIAGLTVWVSQAPRP